MCVQDFVGGEGRVPVLKETLKTTGLESSRFLWYGKSTGVFFLVFFATKFCVSLRKSQVPWAAAIK